MALMGRVRTVFTGVGGAPYYNNLYFLNVVTLADAQAAVDLVDQAWTSLTTVMAGALLGTIEAEVPIIESANGQIQSVFATSGGVVDPTSAAEPLPWASQGLIRLATNQFIEGRRVRGRIFIPGLTESSNANGVPDTNIIASMSNMGAILLAPQTPTLCVFSRPIEADPDAVPPIEGRAGSAHVVESAVGWNQWAQLRSRRD